MAQHHQPISATSVSPSTTHHSSKLANLASCDSYSLLTTLYYSVRVTARPQTRVLFERTPIPGLDCPLLCLLCLLCCAELLFVVCFCMIAFLLTCCMYSRFLFSCCTEHSIQLRAHVNIMHCNIRQRPKIGGSMYSVYSSSFVPSPLSLVLLLSYFFLFSS